MFETSVVRTRAVPSRSRAAVFTLSLAAHTAVVVGVIAMSIATTQFPTAAPNEFALAPFLTPVQIPPPLGLPHAAATPQPKTPPAAAPKQPVAPSFPQTPSIVPDSIPTVTPGNGDASASSSSTSSGPVGVPWGTPDAVGDADAPPSSVPVTPVAPPIYTIQGDVKAPQLLRRVDPEYPQLLLNHHLGASVVVRCVIDRNGRVRDPQIVRGSFPAFNEAVVAAVEQWRFKPGSLHGEAVETYLDLTVNFTPR